MRARRTSFRETRRRSTGLVSEPAGERLSRPTGGDERRFHRTCQMDIIDIRVLVTVTAGPGGGRRRLAPWLSPLATSLRSSRVRNYSDSAVMVARRVPVLASGRGSGHREMFVSSLRNVDRSNCTSRLSRSDCLDRRVAAAGSASRRRDRLRPIDDRVARSGAEASIQWIFALLHVFRVETRRRHRRIRPGDALTGSLQSKLSLGRFEVVSYSRAAGFVADLTTRCEAAGSVIAAESSRQSGV